MSETTEHGMLIERVKELRDRVKTANESPWIPGAFDHDVNTMNEAIAALEQPRCYWQTMDTAPKDGTYVLLSNQYGTWVGAYVERYTSGWRPPQPWHSMMLNVRHMPKARSLVPTHWMPLPDPPEAA